MSENKNPRLFIVIPCYNEQEVLPISAPMFLNKLQELIDADQISADSRILFVNDGSKDRTWEIISQLSVSNPMYQGLSLSRNRGHQNALLAGLMTAKDQCDITISIDCDGQDDVNAMNEMVAAYADGCEIVYGVRNNRDTDSAFKRSTAQSFYKLMNTMGAEVVYNHADYRLMSKRALEALSQYKEVNIFLRGMVPMVGFKSTSVYYKREERMAGESHYPLKKMVAFAVDGITSLSVKPIRIITGMGFFFCILALIAIIWAIVREVTGNTVSGWASTVCIVLFIGGVQTLSIGVIGEYIGKIYMETKQRPRYIIGDATEEMKKEED